MEQHQYRPTWLLLERFVLWSFALAVALPRHVDHAAVLLTLGLAALYTSTSFILERKARTAFVFSASVVTIDLAIAVLRSHAHWYDKVSFAAFAGALVLLLTSLFSLGELTSKAYALFALPLVLLFTPFRNTLSVALVFLLLATVLHLASRRSTRPLVKERPDVKDRLEAVDTAAKEGIVLSVVLPAFNTGQALATTVRQCHEALKDVSHEIIVVSDGSSDGAPEALDDESVSVITKPNGGKGTAFALGALSSSGEFIALLDADGDINPSHLRQMLAVARDGGIDLVVGSKRASGAEFPASPIRRAYSWGFQVLQRALLPTRVRDSQVGCKIARRDLVLGMLDTAREPGFLVDLELLCHASDSKRQVLEFPVRVVRQGGSSVSSRSALRMLYGVLGIWASRLFSAPRGVTPAASRSL